MLFNIMNLINQNDEFHIRYSIILEAIRERNKYFYTFPTDNALYIRKVETNSHTALSIKYYSQNVFFNQDHTIYHYFQEYILISNKDYLDNFKEYFIKDI